MLNVNDIRQHFIKELKNETYSSDKSGVKTIELIGASFHADEPAIFGTPNQEYIDAEINWYRSGSLNIHDIYDDREPPVAWQQTANDHGEINSNYGNLIWSDKYYQQYEMVLDELIIKGDSTRRATMVYNRPSVWVDYNENDKNDFICTNAVTYYIRDGYLHAVVQMRSNDVVFGYKNDYAWQLHVLNNLVEDYNACDPENEITAGKIIWQVQNLHVYSRHFDLVK